MFDSWSECFHYDIWMSGFENCAVDPDFYTVRERKDDEIFPWDFLDCGVTKEFLLREWKKAQSEDTSPNCRAQCQGCGANRFGGGICTQERDTAVTGPEKGTLPTN